MASVPSMANGGFLAAHQHSYVGCEQYNFTPCRGLEQLDGENVARFIYGSCIPKKPVLEYRGYLG